MDSGGLTTGYSTGDPTVVLLGATPEGQEIPLKCFSYSSPEVCNYYPPNIQDCDPKSLRPLSDGANDKLITAPKASPVIALISVV